MTELEVTKSILEKIVLEEIPFATALRNGLKKNNVPNSSKGNISALLGCELRHHLLFDNLVDRYFDKPDFSDTVYLRFYLSNRLFLHRYKNDEIYPLVIKSLPQDKVDLLIEFISKTNEIIPANLDKSSPEFLALRFNTPAWVVRMWQKQYGKGLTFKILKANYHRSVRSVRINNQLTTKEEVLNRHPDLVASPIEDILIFNGNDSTGGGKTIKTFEEFKQNKIFYMKMATKYVLDKLELEPLKRIAIFSDVPNNIYLDLVARFGKNVAADIVISHTQSFFESQKVAEVYGYNNIAIYNAESSSLITCISHKVGTMICMPTNTFFDFLRSVPDYFLRIKQENLDGILKKEADALEECSKLVELDGDLVYMVPTICKKESSTLIANFLFDHRDFELVEEKQLFPFESLDSCLYYAIMKKKGSTDD